MELTPLDRELTDGVVTLRQPVSGDTDALIAGRDEEFHRFIGEGSDAPEPTAVVLNGDGQIVGWIDYDAGRQWLAEGEVNVGYNTFPEYRGRGMAGRSLELLISFLAGETEIGTATLLIDPANAPSIALARRAGFEQHDEVDGQLLFKRSVR